MGARYYDPSIGRFLSQDLVFLVAGFDLSDPQSINSYAYARNNPIRMVDPDGMWFKDMVKTFANIAWGGVKQAAHQAVGLATLATSFVSNPVGTTQAVAKSLYSSGKQSYVSAKALVTSPQARSEAVQGTNIAANNFLSQSLAAQADQTGSFLMAGMLFFVGPKGLGSEATALKVGDSIPQGVILPNRAAEINSISGHAVKQMFERNVMPSDIADVANNPLVRLGQNHGPSMYLNQNFGLIVDDIQKSSLLLFPDILPMGLSLMLRI